MSELVSDILIVSNLDPEAETFEGDGRVWNVSRAWRDCQAGKHRAYVFAVAETLEHNLNIEVNPDKVAAFADNPAALDTPLIFIMEHGKLWLIDGHHRLRAMALNAMKDFVAFVIEEQDAKPYQVWFNGQRTAPWYKPQKASADHRV